VPTFPDEVLVKNPFKELHILAFLWLKLYPEVPKMELNVLYRAPRL
jgi:hypothetical protein